MSITYIDQQTAGGRYAVPVMLSTKYLELDGHGSDQALEIGAAWIDVARATWTQHEAPSLDVWPESSVGRLRDLTVSHRFQRLAREWKSRDTASSLVMDHVQHPAYQKIIGMGEKAVPLLLEQLRSEGDDPDHWFWALHVITDEDPIPARDRGNMAKMAAAWLEWGRRDARAR